MHLLKALTHMETVLDSSSYSDLSVREVCVADKDGSGDHIWKDECINAEGTSAESRTLLVTGELKLYAENSIGTWGFVAA